MQDQTFELPADPQSGDGPPALPFAVDTEPNIILVSIPDQRSLRKVMRVLPMNSDWDETKRLNQQLLDEDLKLDIRLKDKPLIRLGFSSKPEIRFGKVIWNVIMSKLPKL